VTGAYRINYEILGNSEAALHAHIFPRYQSEAAQLRKHPAWFYDWNSAPRFDPDKNQPLMSKIADYLRQAGIEWSA
jgi:diadenosine tetraphosphate (Ap4A) HIT family hydrolase